MTGRPFAADFPAPATAGKAEAFAGELELHGIKVPLRAEYDDVRDAQGKPTLFVHAPHLSAAGRDELARIIARAINEAAGVE